MPEQAALLTLLVLVAASTLHASVGFGTALVAMPLLVMLVGLETATPLVGLAGLATVLVVLRREWSQIDFRAAGRLLVASTAGIPLGIYAIRYIPGVWITTALGVVLVLFGIWSLLSPQLPRLTWRPAVYLAGLCAGVLGGAYNINGPPVVIYGALAQWSPAQFRATISGYFLPTALMVCGAHALAGLWTARVFELLAWGLPGLVAGNFCGRWLGERIAREQFARLLHMLIFALGCLLLVQSTR